MLTRNFSLTLRVFRIGFVLWAACSASYSLQGSELHTGISRLFESGAKNTPPALAAAKSQYEDLKRRYPMDTRIDYAYGLVLVNQHKYRDAVPFLSHFLATGRPEPGDFHSKIWAQLQDRRFADALNEAVALSRRFSGDPSASGGAQFDDSARFMGAVFGYLDLARPSSIDAGLKAKRRADISKLLGSKFAPSFDEGRNSVARRLAELQIERKSAIDNLAAAAQKKETEDKSALGEDLGTVEVQRAAMQSGAEQLQQVEREFELICNQLASLQADRTRLGAQIITIQAQLTQISNPNNSTISVNPTTGQSQIFGNNAISSAAYAQAAALSRTLVALNKQAFDLDRRMLALQQRAAALSEKGHQEAQSLAQRDAVVQQTERHAKVIERKLRREEAAKPKASTVGLTSQMTSLSTYLPFPYEQEKKRVLGWFENDEE